MQDIQLLCMPHLTTVEPATPQSLIGGPWLTLPRDCSYPPSLAKTCAPSLVSTDRPAGDVLAVVAGVRGREGASLTPKQVKAFCDHIDQLVQARVFDTQTFTLLITPPSITTLGLRFMTFKAMARTPVDDWKTEWNVSTILDCLQRDTPGLNKQGRWVDSEVYKTVDAYNISMKNGDKHLVLMRAFPKATSKVAFHKGDSSKSGSRYGPGDKPEKYKTTRYSDMDSKHHR